MQEDRTDITIKIIKLFVFIKNSDFQYSKEGGLTLILKHEEYNALFDILPLEELEQLQIDAIVDNFNITLFHFDNILKKIEPHLDIAEFYNELVLDTI